MLLHRVVEHALSHAVLVTNQARQTRGEPHRRHAVHENRAVVLQLGQVI